MNSLNDISLNISFRLKTEIFLESDFIVCFEKLKIDENDLIITGTNFIDQFKDQKVFRNAEVLDINDYGTSEPTESMVNKAISKANEFPYKRIIAVGGGAVIDIAKLCTFGDGRNVKELFSDKLLLTKKRELIAIPTTCGTGSEVTSVSVVGFEDLNSKLGLQIDELFPEKTFLVDELLRSLPYKTFAITSIDALSHAIESLLSPKANAYTDMFAKSAIEGVVENLTEIRSKNCLPSDLKKSLICANMAGIAFSVAGCATMHALSFPLGSNYKLAHGEAVYAVFGSVLKYYKSQGTKLDKLENILSLAFKDTLDPIAEFLKLLHDVYGCPSLKKLGVNDQKCDEFALSVYENQQRLLINSPIVLNSTDLANIYKNCLKEDSYDCSNQS